MFWTNNQLKEENEKLKEEIKEQSEYSNSLQKKIKCFDQLKMVKELPEQTKDYISLCEKLGFKRQSFIAKMEAETNTKFMAFREEEEKMWLKIETKSCLPNTNKSLYDHSICVCPIEKYEGKMTQGVLLRYVELKPYFDEILIMYPKYSTDPIMYGTKKYLGEDIFFKIMEWD